MRKLTASVNTALLALVGCTISSGDTGYLVTEAGLGHPQTNNQLHVRNYDFVIGENVSDMLLQQCSIVSGTILNIASAGQAESDMKHVDFGSAVLLAGPKFEGGNPTQFNFYTRSSNKASDEERVFEDVELRPGIQLVVSECGKTNGYYKLVVSDSRYFASLQNAIDLDKTSFLEKSSVKEIVERLSKETDHVLAGYVVQRFWRNGYSGDVKKRADVMSKLLGRAALPDSIWPTIQNRIYDYLSTEAALSNSERNDIVSSLIKIGSGTDSNAAQQAIGVLINLVIKGKFTLKTFGRVNASFLENYKTLNRPKITPDQRRIFEDDILVS